MYSQPSASSLGDQHAVTPQNHRQLLLSILGGVLPFVAGTMVWWIPAIWGTADVFDAPMPLYIVLVGALALAFAGAALLRTTWAFLIVPVAWTFGQALMLLVIGMTRAGGVSWEIMWGSTTALVSLAAFPLLIAAGLGLLFRQWVEQRRH
ncbi:MAG TPA: hypothetical protein VFU88_09635 [Ktedonobacterales bacterium]|nr:hypothetical protein [Ktedonobacterales bacterium]